MASVVQRIWEIKQPRGGYVPLKSFRAIHINKSRELHLQENIAPSLVGLAVDYLTRCAMGTPVRQAFEVSIMGAGMIGEERKALALADKMKKLDTSSIVNACKLSGYDVWTRAGGKGYRPVEEIYPNENTIENIREMVKRGVRFFREFGPMVLDGFTFEGGYTELITCGDGDYLTKDTLWDFKVSKYPPDSSATLQLLIYYLMGKHSIHKEFQNIKQIGIFNPRLNMIWMLQAEKIPEDVIYQVSKNVIGYEMSEKSEYNNDTLSGVTVYNDSLSDANFSFVDYLRYMERVSRETKPNH